jgi:hypothetical protein
VSDEGDGAPGSLVGASDRVHDVLDRALDVAEAASGYVDAAGRPATRGQYVAVVAIPLTGGPVSAMDQQRRRLGAHAQRPRAGQRAVQRGSWLLQRWPGKRRGSPGEGHQREDSTTPGEGMEVIHEMHDLVNDR